jgi:hypothetical protein
MVIGLSLLTLMTWGSGCVSNSGPDALVAVTHPQPTVAAAATAAPATQPAQQTQAKTSSTATTATNATVATSAGTRVTCKCGTWSGAKGPPGPCQKLLQQQQASKSAPAPTQ